MLFVFLYFGVLRQDHISQTCLHLPNSGITGMHHHAGFGAVCLKGLFEFLALLEDTAENFMLVLFPEYFIH